ncbi:hypothetical protein BH20CHL7_BH20CHL7_06490 [soil metagenome]
MEDATVRTMIAALFLVGPIVVVPLGLWLVPDPAGGRSQVLLHAARWLSLPVGAALAVAFALLPGMVAGLLAVPWLGMAILAALAALLDTLAAAQDGRLTRLGAHHGNWAALAFLAVAAGNALADRSGIQPFGFAPVIILMTAVHFTFAGFALVLVGTHAHASGPGRATAAAGSSSLSISETQPTSWPSDPGRGTSARATHGS